MSVSTGTVEATPSATLLEGPALQAPEGITAQITNRSGEQSLYYLCVSICTVVTGVFLLLRLYTKLRIIRKIDITDYIVEGAFLFFIAMTVVGRQTLAEGGGVHMWNLQLKHFINMKYVWLNITQILYAPTNCLVKLAILLQYLRLLAPTRSLDPVMFVCARAIIVIIVIYYLAINAPLKIFGCTPREKIWNTLLIEGHCLNINTVVFFTRIFNVVSDITILVLPARSVWRLQIAPRKKIGLVLLFATGLLACVANAMMFTHVVRMEGKAADASYNALWMTLWAYAEISLGIIVICTLTLPKFIDAKGKKLWGTFTKLARALKSCAPSKTLVRLSKLTSSGAATRDREVAVHQFDSETGSSHSTNDCVLEMGHSKTAWTESPAKPKAVHQGYASH